MNFEGKGKKIAIVKSKRKGVKDRDLYVDFNPSDKSLFNSYECEDDEYIQQVPMPTSESKRNILYICGASGSGKSYYATQYLKEYRKCFKDNPIYFFSSVENDFGKGIKGLKKIKLNDDFVKLDLTMDDVKDCMLIYDDTDCIRNKLLRNKLYGIADKVLQTGRHYNTSMIFTNHLPYDGNNTKMILNEAHTITFPSLLGGKGRKYLLENYIGLDNDEIKKLRKLPSRMLTIVKGNPMVCLYERGAKVIGAED